MRWHGTTRPRPLRAVPWPIPAVLAILLASMVWCAWHMPAPRARAVDLPAPPSLATLQLLAFGEPVALAKASMLWLQAFDNQPGVSIPFHRLDYARVTAWMERILQLDPHAQYPLLAASRLYAEIDDPARQRWMLRFIEQQFLADPARRWPWIAHGVILAHHRLHDSTLALHLARTLRSQAPHTVPAWARQMEIFLLEDRNEHQAAALFLGGLLESGAITDPAELRFLTQRLESLKSRP